MPLSAHHYKVALLQCHAKITKLVSSCMFYYETLDPLADMQEVFNPKLLLPGFTLFYILL